MAQNNQLVRPSPPSTDPTDYGQDTRQKGRMRAERLKKTRPGVVDSNNPQPPPSPQWPPNDEGRCPYHLKAPPRPLNGRQVIVRTCEVCGFHFIQDSDYYEHMKTYHPWAPRSHKHGVYRPPTERANHFIPKFDSTAPDVRSLPYIPPDQDIIDIANKLAEAVGFDIAHPDGPPNFHITETERAALLMLYGLDNFIPEPLNDGAVRFGRIIAPTYKNGTPITKNTPGCRQVLATEGLLPPRSRDRGLNAGDVVVYLSEPGAFQPYFRLLDGRTSYIPWRQIQPLHTPFGLPVNIPTLTSGGFPLPMHSVTKKGLIHWPSLEDIVNGSIDGEDWTLQNNEIVLATPITRPKRDRTSRYNTRIADYEGKVGEVSRERLAPVDSLFPWDIRLPTNWLLNYLRRQSLSGNATNRHTTTNFRLGRIIAATSKIGQLAKFEGEYLPSIPLRYADDPPGQRWSVGSLVLYLDEEDSTRNRFRDIFGNEQVLPTRIVQSIHRPFDLPANLPLSEEGVGLPIVTAESNFHVHAVGARDIQKKDCKPWEARLGEMLLRTNPAEVQYNDPWEGRVLDSPEGSPTENEIRDYEGKSGNIHNSEVPCEYVTKFPWGIKVDPKELADLLRGYSISPSSTSPTQPPLSPAENPPTTLQTNPIQSTTPPPSTPSQNPPTTLQTKITQFATLPSTPSQNPLTTLQTNPSQSTVPSPSTPTQNPPTALQNNPTQLATPPLTTSTTNPATVLQTNPLQAPVTQAAPPPALLRLSDYQGFVTELGNMQASHSWIREIAPVIRQTIIDMHVTTLRRGNRIVESQAHADWRPTVWTHQADLVARAPLDIIDPIDVQYSDRLLEICNRLKASGEVDPQSIDSNLSIPTQHFTHAHYANASTQLGRLLENELESGQDTVLEQVLDAMIETLNNIIKDFFPDQMITITDGARKQEINRRLATMNAAIKPLIPDSLISAHSPVWEAVLRIAETLGSRALLKPVNFNFIDLLTLPTPEEGRLGIDDFADLIKGTQRLISHTPKIDDASYGTCEELLSWARGVHRSMTDFEFDRERPRMANRRQTRWASKLGSLKSSQANYESSLSEENLAVFRNVVDYIQALVDLTPHSSPVQSMPPVVQQTPEEAVQPEETAPTSQQETQVPHQRPPPTTPTNQQETQVPHQRSPPTDPPTTPPHQTPLGAPTELITSSRFDVFSRYIQVPQGWSTNDRDLSQATTFYSTDIVNMRNNLGQTPGTDPCETVAEARQRVRVHRVRLFTVNRMIQEREGSQINNAELDLWRRIQHVATHLANGPPTPQPSPTRKRGFEEDSDNESIYQKGRKGFKRVKRFFGFS